MANYTKFQLMCYFCNLYQPSNTKFAIMAETELKNPAPLIIFKLFFIQVLNTYLLLAITLCNLSKTYPQ